MKFSARIIWIQEEFGGRRQQPFVGYRPSIRFQQHIDTWLTEMSSVEVRAIVFDKGSWASNVELELPSGSSLCDLIKVDELIELLEGDRVIGVGKIL